MALRCIYLAKYISKPEPMTKMELPENASAPEKYLKTRLIGAIEALEVLMGFQQLSMSRLAIYLPSEVMPTVKVLKSKKLLEDRFRGCLLLEQVSSVLVAA